MRQKRSLRERLLAWSAAASVALACAWAASPSVALADVGRIRINEETASGEPLPESTIVITDAQNCVVAKYVNDTGLAEFDLPEDITSKLVARRKYTFGATATGYTFNSRTAELADAAEVTVNLTATRIVSVSVRLEAVGVTDYSGVTAFLYDGTNLFAESRTSVIAAADGSLQFDNVPVGADYSIKLTCPPELAGQFQDVTTFSVAPDQQTTQEVVIKGTAMAYDIEEQTVEQVPEPLQKYEAPVQQQSSTPQQPRPVSTQPIAQTGDAAIIVAGGAIAVAALAIIVLVIRRK